MKTEKNAEWEFFAGHGMRFLPDGTTPYSNSARACLISYSQAVETTGVNYLTNDIYDVEGRSEAFWGTGKG